MKKNIILLGALIISGVAYSQVGIDTDTPKATLDIKASPTSTTKIDGLIAPRLKGSELKAKNSLYGTDQDAAIVYVTEALALGDTDDKTLNVTSIGYYYFDKTVGTAGRWMKIANPTAVVAYQEPWNNASDNQPATSNTSDIYQLGKVGIGTTSPAQRLDVNGTAKAVNLTNGGTAPGSNDFGLYSQTPTWMRYVTAATNHVWYTDGASGNNYGGTNPSMLLSSTGNLGIGTINPSQTLDVNGASRLRGQIYDNNNAAGANGQVLSTNSSGQVVWQNNIAITPMAIGVMNSTAPSNAINSADYNTGAYIDLPAGKWVVNAIMLLTKTGSFLANGASLWIRAAFSTSPSSFIPVGNILSGSLVGPSQFGLMNGIVVINNTSGSIQRYYLWRGPSLPYGTATGAEVLDRFGGDYWGENQIVATPAN